MNTLYCLFGQNGHYIRVWYVQYELILYSNITFLVYFEFEFGLLKNTSEYALVIHMQTHEFNWIEMVLSSIVNSESLIQVGVMNLMAIITMAIEKQFEYFQWSPKSAHVSKHRF